MNVIRIVLKIKSPSKEINEVDLTTKNDEIVEAVNVFNDKFRDWSKRLVVIQITKRAMHLLLIMEKTNISENLSVREIRYFIQYLRNNKNWNIYTREKNKMFETVEFIKINEETTNDFIEKVKANESLYLHQKQDIDFINQNEVIKIIDSERLEEMSDEDIITVIEYLIKTKNKGKKSFEKIEDLNKIKIILNKWL